MLLVEYGMVAHPPGLVRTYFHGFASFLSVLTLSLCSCAAASALSSSPPTLSVSQRVSVHAGRRSGTTKSHRQTNACSTSFFPSTEKGKRKKKKSACSPVKSTGSALASDHLETREHTFRGAFKVSHAESLAVQLRVRIYTRNIPDITKCNKAVDI